MKLFVTDDLAAACREAHTAFTHNVVADMTWSIAPRLFDTAPIADMVTALYAPWHGELGQVQKWQAKGGVMLWRNKNVYPAGQDVLLVVEPPATRERLSKLAHATREYVVVQKPIWSSMLKTVELHHPSAEEARRIFEHCKGRKVYIDDAAHELDIPVHYLSRMWTQVSYKSFTEAVPRMMPDTAEGREWWPKLDKAPKHMLRAWAKSKNLVLKRGAFFTNNEPYYDRIESKRRYALSDLEELRSLLESAESRPPV
jgi:hypothetical protein